MGKPVKDQACPNAECAMWGKLGHGNVTFHGFLRLKRGRRRRYRCEACGGSGAAPGTTPVRCSTCNGVGEVQRTAQSLFGQFVSVAPCPTCGGQGTVVEHPCEECHGDGRVRREREVKVDVPAGVSDNNYLTIRGGGVAGPRLRTDVSSRPRR